MKNISSKHWPDMVHTNSDLPSTPLPSNRPWVYLGQQGTQSHASCCLSQILYGVTVLASQMEVAVFSEFWEAISFPG